MIASAVYIGLMAIPFTPGVELGLSMILIFGYKICFLVYISTVVALIPPYLVGRLVPPRHCIQAFKFLGLTRPAISSRKSRRSPQKSASSCY